MKYGVYADIHGNFDAAKVVFDFFKEQKLNYLLCLGDIVGYGPEPNRCIELVEKHKSFVVAGNHDCGSVGLLNIEYFSHYAKQVILWTQDVLTDYNKQILNNLGLVFNNKDITGVHGSLDNPFEFKYIYDLCDARSVFDKSKTFINFIAHTHVPIVFLKKISEGSYDVEKVEGSKDIHLDSNYKYVVNVGSVGQPRDGNSRLCCVIYDTETSILSFNRLDYPISKTQAKMKKKALPEFLVNRLGKGY